MNTHKILTKAISKAVDNGMRAEIAVEHEGVGFDKYPTIKIDNYERFIFSHDFCKAFWGDKKHGYRIDEMQVISFKFEEWQYHLQQLAISEDRLKYIEQFI